jgi:tetratricopeptide (TPR) repeat protein
LIPVLRRISFFLIAIPFLFSCGSNINRGRGNSGSAPVIIYIDEPVTGGFAERVRNLTESGVLSSMTQALDLISSRDMGANEFGRLMNGLNTLLIRFIYPDTRFALPLVDLPQTHNYTRIIREAEKGNYQKPSENSTDFFEHILPFFSLGAEVDSQQLEAVIADLDTAGALRPDSLLPAFFRGTAYERAGRLGDAADEYRAAYAISSECYPARINLARVMRNSGNTAAAVSLLQEIIILYPDSAGARRELTVTLYVIRDWARAEPAVDELLQKDPRDGELLLMKARILIEKGQYSHVQAPLDAYSVINPNNRLYLFLRARHQAEGSRSRDSALNYLRSLIRLYPDDEEALIYAVRLLMESQRSADHLEGRELLSRLRQKNSSSVEVLSLSLRESINREDWREAQGYLNRILTVRRNVQDLIDGFYIENGLGNFTRSLSFAKELFDRDNGNLEYALIYISALIDNGNRNDASALAESYIALAANGPNKSRLYYQRSRLQENEETALGDLRSSLFEDPRNLQALISMFEIYNDKREERRAVYYLKQALAIAPENPRLKRYEKDYAALLGKP